MNFQPLSASAAYNFNEEMQTQIAWRGVMDVMMGNTPGQMFDLAGRNSYQANFNFIMSPKVVEYFQSLGYVVSVSGPVAPIFADGAPDSYITNGEDLTGHTSISWNVGHLWPVFNWVSGSTDPVPYIFGGGGEAVEKKK